jgi:hypothetical protein
MSPQNRPLWLRVIDRADQTVTPAANRFVRTDLFADIASLTARVERQVRRRIEHQTVRIWHAYGLPTVSDIRQVSRQVATLEARLRDMDERLEELVGRPEPPPARRPARTRERDDAS